MSHTIMGTSFIFFKHMITFEEIMRSAGFMMMEVEPITQQCINHSYVR